VDGSLGADRAAKWAMANLPKEHRLVMVHGIYAPITGWYACTSTLPCRLVRYDALLCLSHQGWQKDGRVADA
jgi:hypothetical protein